MKWTFKKHLKLKPSISFEISFHNHSVLAQQAWFGKGFQGPDLAKLHAGGECIWGPSPFEGIIDCPAHHQMFACAGTAPWTTTCVPAASNVCTFLLPHSISSSSRIQKLKRQGWTFFAIEFLDNFCSRFGVKGTKFPRSLHVGSSAALAVHRGAVAHPRGRAAGVSKKRGRKGNLGQTEVHGKHMSNAKNTTQLCGDYTTQLYKDSNKPWNKDPYSPTRIQWKVVRFFFRGSYQLQPRRI